MAGAIHPGKRKAISMLTKNGKPRIKGWSLSQLTDAMEKAQRNKDQAKFRKEIQRRFG